MPHSSQAEISMRHLPDVSDTSFQIPVAQDDMLTRGGFELTFDAFDDSELEGLDADPFQTPMLNSRQHAPLTLSEITPRRERTKHRAVNAVSHANILTSSRQENQNAKQTQSSVRPLLPKKESTDDMFERRKRDSYQQMGIDLSSKSTARLRHTVDENARDARTEPDSRTELLETHTIANPPATRKRATSSFKTKTKRPVLGKDAGVVKHKHRVLPSPSAQSIRPKSILKPSKLASPLPTSTLSRTLTALSQTPKAERPKWGDVVAEVQRTSRDKEREGSGIGLMGGGLIDVLVMYGEKLKGSLGFSSSDAPISCSNLTPTRPANKHGKRDSMGNPSHNASGPSSKPLTLSDLSPSRLDGFRRNNPMTLSDFSPSRLLPVLSGNNENSETDEQPSPEMSPLRLPEKRASTGTPRGQRKKNKINFMPPSGRSESKPTQENDRPAVITISKPRALGPSQAANGVYNNVESLRPRTQLHSSNITASKAYPAATAFSRNLKSDRFEASGAIRSRRTAAKDQRVPAASAMSEGPAFASDVHRQRALEKAHAQREKRHEKEKLKRTFKAAPMPYFNKPAPPARPAVRTTVPAAFTFHSDARVAQRNAEFEEKRKTWESRTTHHALPMPDFAAMHAAQAQAQAARGRRAVPVLPTEPPKLTTMVRAKEREKFDEERREREKAMEKLREMREKERAEQEEREYRAARKRAVPKAHEVPEWYKDMPKRKEVA